MAGRPPARLLGLLALLPALLAVGALAACGEAPAARPAADRTFAYAPGLVEDAYLPAVPDGRRGRARVPLVVMVPGGSWRTSDPGGLAGLAAALADAGVAAVTTRVRAAEDGVTYPVPVEDVLCAVAGAVEEVRARGFAPDPVAVLGHSSGAHLAALAALAFRDHAGADAPACRSPLVAPEALVGLSGPYDVTRVPDLASALLGSSPDDDPGAWASADPVAQAARRPALPVLLLHGAADETVPPDFTTQFARALRAGGHPVTVEIVPGADHDTVYSADVAGERVASWLLALPAGTR